MEGNDEDFDLLLELAGEIDVVEGTGGVGEGPDEEGDGGLPKDYAAFIPASDGEESEEEVGLKDDPLEALAEEAETQEPPPKRPKANQAGFQAVGGGNAFSRAAEGPSKLKSQKQTFLPDGVEKYSQIAIAKTLFPMVVLHEKIAGLLFLKVAQVKSRLGPRPPEGPWATVGILTQKATKESAGGRSFSIWTLSDLAGSDTTLFLFAEAHQRHLREPVGSVVAVFNGKIRSEAGKFDVSVEAPEQIIKLGTSKDMGYCKGTKKDGQPCRNAVNRSQCSYCEYHVQAEKRKLGSGRAQLRGNFLKSSLRNAKTHYSGSQVAKASQHIPLKPCSKEQLLAVASNQLNQKTSMGARYVKRMAEEPCQSGYVDPDTPRGFGVFNPSNRVASAAASAPAPKDGLNAPRPSATDRLPSSAPHVLRAPKDSGGILKRAGDMLRAEHSFITPAGHLPPEKEKIPGETDVPPKRRGGPLGNSAAAGPEKVSGVGVAGGATIDHARSPGVARPVSSTREGGSCAEAARQSGGVRSGTGGARCPRGVEPQHRGGNPSAAHRRGNRLPGAMPSEPVAPSQEKDETGEEMVALDDELEVTPAEARQPPVEKDVEWGSTGSRPSQKSLFSTNGKSSGPAKTSAAVPIQRSGVHTHRKVMYDEEVGGMVEVGHADADWLNGRAPMPYQRPKPSNAVPTGWNSPSSQILQKVPNAALKEAKAAQQSLADAEARIRAANILKRRPLSAGGRKTTTVSADDPSTHPAQLASSQSQDGAAKAAEGASTSRGESACTSGSPAQPVNGFYGKASTASAQRANRRYGQAMQAAARRTTNTVSDFTAAFGSVLEDASGDFTGSRYSDLVEDEEHQRLDKVMSGLQARDEVAQKAESVTKLQVSAFQCKTCNYLLENRKPECSGHDVQRVTTTKLWWLCNGCGYHFSTLGVRLPKTRCKRCAGTEFNASAMGRSKKAGRKENLVTTVEQAFAQESVA